jgi:hypothetical protein
MTKLTISLLLFFTLSDCRLHPEPEMYLLPNGFKGKVNVIFNQPNGVDGKQVNGVRLFEIPPSGILLTKLNLQGGFIDRSYYYVDSSGNRKPLKVLNDREFVDGGKSADQDVVGVFHDGTTGVYGNSDAVDPLNFLEFVISDFKHLDSFFSKEYAVDFKQKLSAATHRRY